MTINQANLDAVKANLPGDSARLVAALQGVRGLVATARTDIDAASGSITTLQTQQQSVASRLDAVESASSDISGLSQTVQSHVAAINTLELQVAGLDQAIFNGDQPILSTIAALQAADALFADEDTSFAASLAAQQAGNNSRFTSIEGNVTALTQSMSDVSAEAATARNTATAAQIKANSADAQAVQIAADLVVANTKIDQLTVAINDLLAVLAGESAAVDATTVPN